MCMLKVSTLTTYLHEFLFFFLHFLHCCDVFMKIKDSKAQSDFEKLVISYPEFLKPTLLFCLS